MAVIGCPDEKNRRANSLTSSRRGAQ